MQWKIERISERLNEMTMRWKGVDAGDSENDEGWWLGRCRIQRAKGTRAQNQGATADLLVHEAALAVVCTLTRLATVY